MLTLLRGALIGAGSHLKKYLIKQV